MTGGQWSRVEPILAEALDRDPAERPRYLDEACAGDAALRAEVEALLAAVPAADFLETPAVALAAPWLDQATDPPMPVRIGPYRIEREVGRGGMGVVYLASRGDGEFSQRVAVKLIKRGLDTDDVLRRFRTERQILASLEHPHIARLFDGGTTEDGQPYFVMEYIDGQPLMRYCEERQLSLVARLRLFQKICAAVQSAHQNLVVHRDLKPGNVLVTRDGEPKLLDFGVAKLLDPALDESGRTNTRLAWRAMTPEYASPEQLRGQHVTTATDVYSLGVMLYELLTGARPCRPSDDSPEALVRAVCETPPTRPSTASTAGDGTGAAPGGARRQALKALRGDLDTIILTALRKEPGRRYQSVEQLSEDIDRHLRGLPVMARQDTFVYRASKFVGRHTVGVSAAILVVLAVVGGLVGTIWQARVARQERDRAQQLNAFLQSILAAASPENKGRDAKVIDVLADADQRIDSQFANQPDLKAQALQAIGSAYTSLGAVDQGERRLRAALALDLQVFGPSNLATIECQTALATAVLAEGGFDEAERLLRQSRAWASGLGDPGRTARSAASFALGELFVRKGDFAQAKPLLQEAVQIATSLEGPDSPDTGYIMISLGRAEQYSGDLAGAEATYRKSITTFEADPRFEDRKAMAMLNLGSVLGQRGDYAQAIQTLRAAEQIYRARTGDSYYVAMARSYLTYAYYAAQEFPAAASEGVAATALWRTLKLTAHDDYYNDLAWAGLSLTRTGRAAAGEPYLRELQTIYAATAATAREHATATSELGECLAAQGRLAEAEPLVVHSYEALQASLGDASPFTVAALKRVVALYEAWHKPALAARYRAKLPAA